jgi:hypothetical protein
MIYEWSVPIFASACFANSTGGDKYRNCRWLVEHFGSSGEKKSHYDYFKCEYLKTYLLETSSELMWWVVNFTVGCTARFSADIYENSTEFSPFRTHQIRFIDRQEWIVSTQNPPRVALSYRRYYFAALTPSLRAANRSRVCQLSPMQFLSVVATSTPLDFFFHLDDLRKQFLASSNEFRRSEVLRRRFLNRSGAFPLRINVPHLIRTKQRSEQSWKRKFGMTPPVRHSLPLEIPPEQSPRQVITQVKLGQSREKTRPWVGEHPVKHLLRLQITRRWTEGTTERQLTKFRR